jgi:hypothetical protein
MTNSLIKKDGFSSIAESVAPGMAIVLQKLVRSFLSGVDEYWTDAEIIYLQMAYASLQTVNSTPNGAREIGKQAAKIVSNNKNADNLHSLGIQGTKLIAESLLRLIEK